jgi:hypothetical protein
MPRELGSRKQVFIDWTLIDAGYGLSFKSSPACPRHLPVGVKLTAHPPVLMPAPTFPADQPWEDLYINSGYCTLLQEEGRLRLYYETFSRRDRRSDLSARVCLAESEDGRRWRRDPVGTIEWDGSRRNNIVYSKEIPGVIAAHGANVFKDPSAPPEERYKIIHVGPIRAGEKVLPGVWASVSPDGLHWTPLAQPLMQHTSDTQNVVQYDAECGLYRAFVRGIFPMHETVGKGVHGRRAVDGAVSKDFRVWPKPQTALAPAPDDPPDWDIYTNGYVKWPGADAHLMFPSCYSRGSDLMEVHIAVSRDGLSWVRPQKAPLLAAGEPGTLWEGGLYAGQGIAALTERGLARDHDSATLWAIPLGVILYTHNYLPENDLKTHLQQGPWLATVRPDGFMSLSAETAGECWTYPVSWTGERLLVNSWARGGGSVRIGFETKEGPVSGFSVEESDPLEGDCLWKTATWRGKSDVSALAQQEVCLHIRLLRSRLHAFRFCAAGAP